MDDELLSWQSRLQDHFSTLSECRSQGAFSRPVFGLEHGLDETETLALKAAVRSYILHGFPSAEHSLVWIVYSSELGYKYSGDEYWQTFEAETPGWVEQNDRYWLRNCFLRFQSEFNGAVPTGSWARHFSIICWPITHAILPKDLQRQLARVLYGLRHYFSSELFASPKTLGELVAAHSLSTTSRFQNFVQDPQLVGLVSSALLLHDESDVSEFIHPHTLKRIGNDLDQERQAREWLKSARRFAKERAKVHGLSSFCSRGPFTVGSREEAQAEVAALGIEPRMVLRPLNSEGSSWDATIEIPNLSHLLFRFPSAREVLTGSRCEVAGSTGRPLARGRCLYGTQRVKLARWPKPDEVLLKFENSDPQLDYLLRTECLLRPGSMCLFRVATDGLAYELRSLRVRPGERYILTDSSALFTSTALTQSVAVQCEGVSAILLDLPQALTAEWEDTLSKLGLTQAKSITVWPAGLAAAAWDGEGHGEWLASEMPCLAVSVDHPIDILRVTMGDDKVSSLELTSITPGDPLFVELPRLPVGVHNICISAQANPEEDEVDLGELNVLIRIRDTSSQGLDPNGPMVVQVEPPESTLEQVWEGNADISILGPTSREVSCSVAFFDRNRDQAVYSAEIARVSMPVSPEDWRKIFEDFRRSKPRSGEAYDLARTCDLIFSAKELGEVTYIFEREFKPLRWAILRRHMKYYVRLINDSGDEAQPSVTYVAYDSPAEESQLTLNVEYEVPSGGGMYVATLNQLTAGIIVPPVARGLADLSCRPRLSNDRTLDSVVRLIGFARLWGLARLPGDFLSATRKRDVLMALGIEIARLICGNAWAETEKIACRDVLDQELLKKGISQRQDEQGMVEVIAEETSALAKRTCTDRAEKIASILTTYRILPSRNPEDISNAAVLSEFALRLASNPSGVENWAGDRLRSELKQLLEFPTIMRVARFLVLSINCYYSAVLNFDRLYAGWQWK